MRQGPAAALAVLVLAVTAMGCLAQDLGLPAPTEGPLSPLSRAPSALPLRETAAPELERLRASLGRWHAMRDNFLEGYSYRASSSSFTGATTTTTVVVKHHRVIQRQWVYQASPQTLGPTDLSAWTETAQDVGTHGQGFPALTLDELYAQALRLFDLPLQRGERLELGFDDRGLLHHCYLTHAGAADDRPMNGVRPIELHLPGVQRP